jgi:tRNA(fMet)-specific endonuclease VapC
MIYFLDTNICIRYLNGSSPQIAEKMAVVDLDDIKIPTIVAAELFYGAFKSAKREYNLSRFRAFVGQFEAAYFDCAAAELYGEIRATLESNGETIGWNDLLIAATAKANDGVLVTNNTREFVRVKGLRLDDWTMNH